MLFVNALCLCPVKRENSESLYLPLSFIIGPSIALLCYFVIQKQSEFQNIILCDTVYVELFVEILFSEIMKKLAPWNVCGSRFHNT